MSTVYVFVDVVAKSVLLKYYYVCQPSVKPGIEATILDWQSKAEWTKPCSYSDKEKLVLSLNHKNTQRIFLTCFSLTAHSVPFTALEMASPFYIFIEKNHKIIHTLMFSFFNLSIKTHTNVSNHRVKNDAPMTMTQC